MKRLRSCFSLVGGTILVAVALVAFAGPAAYVELAGRTASGQVIARREEISVRYSEWTRSLRLESRAPSAPNFWKNLYGYAIIAGLILPLALGVWAAGRYQRALFSASTPAAVALPALAAFAPVVCAVEPAICVAWGSPAAGVEVAVVAQPASAARASAQASSSEIIRRVI